MDTTNGLSKTVHYVGIGHQRQVGKGCMARAIGRAFKARGVRVYEKSFATPLKALVSYAFGAGFAQLHGEDRDGPVPAWVASSTGGRTWREVLQNVGCRARANWPGIWLHHAFRTHWGDPCVVIVSDMRFAEEFDAIKEHGGDTVRVHRDIPRDGHMSESLLDNAVYDYNYDNNVHVKCMDYWARLYVDSTLRKKPGLAPTIHGKTPARGL